MKPVTDDGDRTSGRGLEDASGETRRGFLGTGMKLAIAAPVVLLAAQTGIASADEGDDQGQQGDSHGNGRGNGRGNRGRGPRTGTSLSLVRVSQVSTNDFSPTNAGSDPLTSGSISVMRQGNGQNAQVLVDANGAAANVSYEVFFVRFNDKGREDVGGFKTDSNGRFRGFTSSTLGGSNRVGTFVVQNGSSDEFVTCFPTS